MELTLVYPHQLFASHPAVETGRRVALIEDPLFFGNDPHWPTAMHVQKLVLHRASMKAFAAELEGHGHEVKHIDCPNGGDIDSTSLLERELPKSTKVIHLCDVEDDILRRRIERFAETRGVELVVHPSPNFLTPADFLEEHIGSKKKPFTI